MNICITLAPCKNFISTIVNITAEFFLKATWIKDGFSPGDVAFSIKLRTRLLFNCLLTSVQGGFELIICNERD